MADPVQEQELLTEMAEACAKYSRDPLGFAEWAFPWGEPTYIDFQTFEECSNPLERSQLEEWQSDVLAHIRDELGKIPKGAAFHEVWSCVTRIAIASGHGIGKSALMAILILWAMSTYEDCRGVITATTGDQLWKKTWPELHKWHRMCTTASWFTLTATALYSSIPAHEKTWRFDALAWSEHNSEAFAGLHNKDRRVLVLFDEASGVAPKIWEVVQGAFSDANTECIFVAFGNPTKATGEFRSCFGRDRKRYYLKQIDARTVSFTNKEELQEQIDTYGLDSDRIRIRVLGKFPHQSDAQFIPTKSSEEAALRDIPNAKHQAVIIGVDTARGGQDSNVIYTRHGRDARSYGFIKLPSSAKAQTLAGRIATQYAASKADMIFVDAANIGMAVVDLLDEWKYPVRAVHFGENADDPIKWANKRVEMWGRLKELLPEMAVVDDQELHDDLVGPEYGHTSKEQQILEKKEHMKARGLASPDIGDALALTFAYPVLKVEKPYPDSEDENVAVGGDFDPFD